MLSLIQEEVVTNYGWLSLEEFTEVVAISQMTPGPIGINSATYIGYQVTGSVWGAVLTTFAVSLPSFLIVLLISRYYAKFRKNKYVDAAFVGIRPTTVGLIASAALLLTFQSGFIGQLFTIGLGNIQLSDIVVTENFIDWKSILIFAAAFIVTVKKWLHPMLTIVAAAVLGLILY